MHHHRWLTLLVATAGFVAPKLMADPPARVGRLNLINGSVSFRAASVDEWAVAEPNRTLTTGDRLWTDNNSRAEVHVGSTAIRLGAQTEFDFVNVDDQTVQGRLAQGTATIHVRNLDDGEVYEIDTPNGAVSLGSAGLYRIDVNTDGTQTKVVVWQGGAEVTAAGSSFQVNQSQVATVSGTDSPTYDLGDIGSPDDWDTWCLGRDAREDHSVSAQYVSREMPGYEDLDAYGHWTAMPGYGNVWVPDNVTPGWAPYHTGHWVWVDPWGWSWVDTAPWGYAPYHYGRWAYAGGVWFWSPGPPPPPPPPPGQVVVVYRPVYAPALVAFVGGGGWSVGVSAGGGGGGGVAWVALGIGEPYHPGYAVSPGYVNHVNYTSNTTVVNNTTNVTVVNNTTINNYHNAGAPGAVTAMPQSAMASGASVQTSAVPVTKAQLAAAPAASSAPPVVPTKAAVTGSAGAGAGRHTPAVPPASVENRAVVAKTAPPPAPVPFEAKQKALAANGGKPLAPAQENQIRSSLPPSKTASLVKPASNTGAAGGLKPARPGLAAAKPVQGAGGNGFVSHQAAAQQNKAVGQTAAVAAKSNPTPGGGSKPAVTASRAGAPAGGNSNVPHPPERTGNGGGSTGTNVNNANAGAAHTGQASASRVNTAEPVNKPAPKPAAKKPPPKPEKEKEKKPER
jgi:hypothetical protein